MGNGVQLVICLADFVFGSTALNDHQMQFVEFGLLVKKLNKR